MPVGEEMFKFHGYSGSCPKPPLSKPQQKEKSTKGRGMKLYKLTKDSQPLLEQPIESSTWTKLKWWQVIKPGDKFLDLPTDKWVRCVNLVGLLAWDLVVIRPSKPRPT